MGRKDVVMGIVPIAMAVALLALAAVVADADAGAMFPFVIPWNDASKTITDVSYLNDGPAGSHGFIVVKNGHFVESDSGQRIRFLGVNLVAGSAFPNHADARIVARRLAKYGVNLVRLHHMDNCWNNPKGTIWDLNDPDHRHINPRQLDRLDYLIYELKRHGIYVNINLHVSRQFSPADGFPASVSDIPFSFDKRVDYFDPSMIELQKEYARQLLTHVNPYTHTAYTDEPAVLNVELTNEDSLVGDPWSSLGHGLKELPQPFLGELQQLWNRWLAQRYGATTKLKAAWLKNVTPPGPDLLKSATDLSSWTLEQHRNTKADLSIQGDALRADVAQTDGTDWHIQLHQAGLNIQDGDTYTVRFRARANPAREMSVYTSLDESDWHHIGLDVSAHLTPEWKQYTYFFTAHHATPDHSRLVFVLGNQTGEVELAQVKLSAGVEGGGLQPGQTCTNDTIPIPDGGLPQQWADWIAFLTHTERAYNHEMRDYLKNDLHLHANIICSQISYGGLSGPYREEASEFADDHAYWEHPRFPRRPWDPVDWLIGNTSMVPAIGQSDTLTAMAEYRIAGKPFTVSEYNHPAPNDYQSECVPLYASFAAFQDWDAIYLFDYGSYGANAANDQIQSYFGVGSNPAKWAFMPAAAMIFRDDEIGPAGESVTASIPAKNYEAELAQFPTAYDLWNHYGITRKTALSRRMGIQMGGEAGIHKAGAVGNSTLECENSDPATAIYTADAPAAKVVVGFVGGRAVTVGKVRFEFGDTPHHFAALILNSLDRKPLSESSRILLTAADRVENTDMIWNAAHNSVNNHWGTAPSIADGVPVTLTMPVSGPRKVYALTETGALGQEVPITYQNGQITFTAGPNYRTLWYAIVKP